jgi:hypothetical protein
MSHLHRTAKSLVAATKGFERDTVLTGACRSVEGLVERIDYTPPECKAEAKWLALRRLQSIRNRMDEKDFAWHKRPEYSAVVAAMDSLTSQLME